MRCITTEFHIYSPLNSHWSWKGLCVFQANVSLVDGWVAWNLTETWRILANLFQGTFPPGNLYEKGSFHFNRTNGVLMCREKPPSLLPTSHASLSSPLNDHQALTETTMLLCNFAAAVPLSSQQHCLCLQDRTDNSFISLQNLTT